MLPTKKRAHLLTATGLLVLLAALLLPTQQACYYDNKEELGTTCDTVGMKYSTDVVNILKDNCYSCHTGTGGSAGIALETHLFLTDYVSSGSLIDRINTTNTSKRMPPDGLMDECNRQKIEAWVKAGALNN